MLVIVADTLIQPYVSRQILLLRSSTIFLFFENLDGSIINKEI